MGILLPSIVFSTHMMIYALIKVSQKFGKTIFKVKANTANTAQETQKCRRQIPKGIRPWCNHSQAQKRVELAQVSLARFYN